jgi:ubiquitin carboxyl-terminal hydrolase 4/11/15
MYGGTSYFGYPTVVALDQKQATSVDAMYDTIVARLERWTENARDLFTWEVAPGAVESVPIQINGVPPLDSLVEIKANGDVVEHPAEAPEGDIADEKSVLVVEDDDIQMESVTHDGVPVKMAPKREIFQLKVLTNVKEYGTQSSFHAGRVETLDGRLAEAETEPVLLREGDVLLCEFDENMKAYYFGDGPRHEHAQWDRWEEFTHPEYEAAQKESEEKKNKGISLQDCMDEFTKQEQLGEDDLWYCPRCKKHQQATKKFDLWKAPDVLVVHLKRFSNSRTLRDKIDAFVDFPVEGLDLGEMVGERAAAKRLIEQGVSLEGLQLGNLDEPLVYDLFGVDEHMGGLGGGHYRAYALNHTNATWYHFDDSYVTPARPQDAVVSHPSLSFVLVSC